MFNINATLSKQITYQTAGNRIKSYDDAFYTQQKALNKLKSCSGSEKVLLQSKMCPG
jgi:hypothetical protein